MVIGFGEVVEYDGEILKSKCGDESRVVIPAAMTPRPRRALKCALYLISYFENRNCIEAVYFFRKKIMPEAYNSTRANDQTHVS